GKEIISAFSGPADVNSFDMVNHVPSSQTIKQKKSPEREEVETLYKNVRLLRENKPATITVKDAFGAVSGNHPNDWLLSVEIAEIAYKENKEELLTKVLNHLESVKVRRPEVIHLIQNGIDLIFQKEMV